MLLMKEIGEYGNEKCYLICFMNFLRKSVSCCMYNVYMYSIYVQRACIRELLRGRGRGIGGMGLEMVSFGTHNSINHKKVTLSAVVFPYFLL